MRFITKHVWFWCPEVLAPFICNCTGFGVGVFHSNVSSACRNSSDVFGPFVWARTIYTYSGTLGCNWACPSPNAFKQAFRQPLFCWSPRSVYILSTSIVRQPWNLLSSLGHNFLTWWCTLCTRRPKQTASDFQALSPPDPNPLSCVASIMCSRNVIIPTPPQPTAIYTPCTKYM